ncbi:hypothetical protein ACJJTC_005868, partial [Scirpophaga incertulas]
VWCQNYSTSARSQLRSKWSTWRRFVSRGEAASWATWRRAEEPVNIPDAYKDERFNHDIDQQTGYKTRSLLCMPIKDINGEVIGVAQVINKQNDGPFTANDEKVFASYLQFCGIGLRNAQLYERSQLEVKRNQVLLDLARMVFEEQSTIEHMVLRILTHTQSLIRCQRVQVLLVHEASKGSFSRVFDLEAGDEAEPGTPRTSPYESRFPINIGITGHVATTGETVNIADAYLDPRFDPSVDEGTGFKHNTILCMAVKNSEGRIIGVIQLVNKFDELLFTKNDENFVEAFAIFCGMGIHNTHMYEKAITAMAKQSVTLDVLSYHASASIDDAQRLRTLRIPSSVHFRLHELDFDDIDMSDDETLSACLRMFLDLDFVERFHIDYGVLCRWLLSVKKNYRNVTYHNWRHAFNVAQMMFAILTETQWWKIFGELECLALIIGCLCHDLDHRGTNNSFQIKASSPLAQLYSTSTMEHHHFDQCLMILNSPGNQILANLSSDDYEKVVKVLEDAILSTDLAPWPVERRVAALVAGEFFRQGDLERHNLNLTPIVSPLLCSLYKWGACGERRALLRAMLMTACDLAAITKPWPVERRVAALVAGEFFRQGDLERHNLNLTPIVSPLLCSLYKWGACGERRALLRAMLMTACDLAAITKPWPVERRVAALVAGEFFRQGDLERHNLNLTPIVSPLLCSLYKWGACGERRALLRAMLMTACDLAAITKPWPVERRVAALVAGEFFRQGDLERHNLNLTPIDIMNRDKEDELPAMQVKFIDTICLPIYEAFAVLSSGLQPMLDRVKSNRAHWIELASSDKPAEKIDLDKNHIQDKHDKSSLSSQNVDDTENTYEGDSSGAVSLSSENSKYDNLENPVVGLVNNSVLAMPREPNKLCNANDLN